MADPPEDRRALYLRWRPLSFSDVVGQEHVVRTLRNAIRNGTPAHAYLFAGPRGTGKTSLARILYRAVNCTASANGDPCGECHACRMALEGRSLDLVEIDAASNRGIDDIRDLREKVSFSPSEVRYRVYIVDEAHELTAPAWDAFLKTLEEPPPHAIFVLATTEAHKVPATIVSRCQRFDLRRIVPEAIKNRLLEIAASEDLHLEPSAADRLARMARGGLRDAISLLDQAASFNAGQVDLDALREVLGLSDPRLVQGLLEAVADRNTPSVLDLLIQVQAAGADVRLFAEDIIAYLRGLLYAGVGASRALAGDYSSEEVAWFEQQAERWESESLRKLLRTVADGLTRIDTCTFDASRTAAVLPAPVVMAPPAASRASSVEAAPPPPTVSSPSEPARTDQPPRREAPTPLPVAQVTVLDVPLMEKLASSGDIGTEATSAVAQEPISTSAGGLDLERIRESWPRVIEWVANRNSFVASYLRPAELSALQDDWLYLTFAFKVHHQRIAQERNRTLVEQACQYVLGQPLKLRCEHVPPSPSAQAEQLDLDDPVLKFALERFGGRAELLRD
jgi:DNA polymerase-3 subunit gamma/tau